MMCTTTTSRYTADATGTAVIAHTTTANAVFIGAVLGYIMAVRVSVSVINDINVNVSVSVSVRVRAISRRDEAAEGVAGAVGGAGVGDGLGAGEVAVQHELAAGGGEQAGQLAPDEAQHHQRHDVAGVRGRALAAPRHRLVQPPVVPRRHRLQRLPPRPQPPFPPVAAARGARGGRRAEAGRGGPARAPPCTVGTEKWVKLISSRTKRKFFRQGAKRWSEAGEVLRNYGVQNKIAAAPIHRGTEPNVDKTAPAAISTNEPGSKTNEAASDDQNSTVGNQVASQILTEPVASSSNPAEPLLNHVMESQASAIDAPKDETISGALVDGKHPVKIETLTVQQKWASMQHNERATLNEVQRALLELFPHHAQNMSVLARSYKFIPLNHISKI
ncbi:hypothetical protein Pelo_11368 [Pelomyxa schiedti]|nr:hypothetical protein Pelo_11368 [Pelomyxa schiedti]